MAKQSISMDLSTGNSIGTDSELVLTVGDTSAQTIEFSGDEDSLDKIVSQVNSQLKGGFAVQNDAGTGFDIISTEGLSGMAASGGSGTALTVAATSAEIDGSLRGSDITTASNANEMVVRVDAALDTVNDLRGELGAIQNRFESTIANLSTSVENLSAANSRIVDADFAAETAKMSKSQVLQQAGISVLAQANARPQQVLSLLQ